MASQVTEQQIDRFLRGECSAEEYAWLLISIGRDPDYQFVLAEWQAASAEQQLDEEISQRMLAQVKLSTRTRMRTGWWAAAASVALIFMSALLYMALRPEEQPAIADNVQQVSAPSAKGLLLRNTSSEIVSYTLPDSSVVKLYAGASVEYREHNSDSRKSRSVYLKGKAYFDVAKDIDKPFIVYTGTVSTTALGTSFTITESEDGFLIHLYTGKVRLQQETTTLAGWSGDIYLLPGEKMNYNKLTGYCKVGNADGGKKVQAAAVTSQPVKQPAMFTLRFQHASLNVVLDSLAVAYKVPIGYDEAEISKRFFSGNIQSTDRLANVLDLIAKLNGLQIQPAPKGYSVKVLPGE